MIRFPLIVVFSFLLVACSNKAEVQQKEVISVSILPERFFIEGIAGDLLEVNVMIPPGASPASYEPTAGQLALLAGSQMYMKIGYVEFELSWMEKIADANPEMHIIDLSEGIELLSDGEGSGEQPSGHDHGGADPHIWMSPLNAKIIARNAYDGLVEIFPEEEPRFARGLELLEKRIDSLQAEIVRLISEKSSRGFMIYHPALTYFARDFQLEQYPLEIGGKEPSPAHMKEMIDLGREKQIHVIFFQKQFDRRNAEVLAVEIGAEIIQIDPLDPDWFTQMRTIAGQLNRLL